MLVMSSPRRLLVVDPCDDCHALLPGLRTSGYFRAPPIIGLQANSVFHEWTYWRLEALTFPVPIANSRCPD